MQLQYFMVDAATGCRVSSTARSHLAADSSGALMWLNRDSTLCVSAGLDSDGRTLDRTVFPLTDEAFPLRQFRFGILLVRCRDCYRAIRFDGDVLAAAEPSAKVSVVLFVVRVCGT